MSLEFIKDELANLRIKDLIRVQRVRAELGGGKISIDGQEVFDLSSNSYLGLHTDVGALSSIELCSGGSTASRLVSGNWSSHEKLEQALALFHLVESACLFNSGYSANLGVISSLVGSGDLVISDRLNHASIIDGCRLSRAVTKIFEHNDIESLRHILINERGRYRRCLVVCESIYSMDGDKAPLIEFKKMAEEFDSILMVDEAHAVGVRGEGRGYCFEVGAVPHILVGTLGKALGSFGAYVCGSSSLVTLLRNTSRPYIYTTALPSHVVDISYKMLSVLKSNKGLELIRRLKENVAVFRSILGQTESDTQIIPIGLKNPKHALEVTGELLSRGLYVQAIRPPTVPVGTSRLRISVHAAMSIEDAKLCAQTIRDVISD